MRCFTHPDAEAVGVCHVCGRAVCPTCARVEVLSLTCSEACATRQKTMTAIIDFNSRNLDYQSKVRIPLMSLFTGGLGTVMVVVGVLPALASGGSFEWRSLVMGSIFLVWAVLMYRAAKKVTRPTSK